MMRMTLIEKRSPLATEGRRVGTHHERRSLSQRELRSYDLPSSFGHSACELGWLARFRVSSYGPTEFRFRLLQPEAHIHVAVHRRRRHEMLVCLRLLPGAPIELPEAEVAVGLERAYAQFLGRHERLTIVCLGALDLGGIS